MKSNWKYMLLGLMLVGISACTNDSEGLSSSENEVSRSTELVSQTITLTSAGTLQAVLEEKMDAPATLQKLTLSGPINGNDVEYWKTTLTALVEFDLSTAVPTFENDIFYNDPGGNGMQLIDNEVGPHMFSYMTKLETIVFPVCATSIQWEACAGCTSLSTADIPASVTHIDHNAFRECAFATVTVPATVTSMNEWAYSYCPELKTVHFLPSMTNIPAYTFYNCPKLETVTLSSSVTTVNCNAFEYCSSLKDYTPFEQITKIDGTAFQATALESVDLSNVTDFSNADWAFRLCESLQSVILPEDMTETLPSYMFWGCTKLSSVNIPAGMHTIGDGVFGGCGFTELVIPSTVKKIGYDSFRSNRSLTKLTLSEGLQSIGYCGFSDTSITEVTIPSTVTSIGESAFQATKLNTLIVPSSVTEVGGSLINDCPNLKALVWNCSAPIDDAYGINSNCYLYLASADIVTGPNWKNIIVDGVADFIELCAGGNRADSNNAHDIPFAFTAKKITFARYFDGTTHPGISSGWQTIVLPFTPTKIEHESKGTVAPFNSEVEGAKPFWLRALTADGFVDKTTIEPNVPYIIAMPNHPNYMEEYCLSGKITFSAENVELAATTGVLPASEGPDYSLQPTYTYVPRGISVYALNVEYWIDGYEYGSAFVRNITDVYAFEAYVTPGGRSARSLFGMDTRSSASRASYQPNKSGIPQIGDM